MVARLMDFGGTWQNVKNHKGEIFSDQGMYENARVRVMVGKNVEKMVGFFEKLIKTIREDFFGPGNA